MKRTHHHAPRRPTIALAVCSALAALAAAPAAADPLLTVKLFRDADIMFRDSDMSRYAENYVELGAGYNSNDSFKFGQFSGLTDKGAFAIANFNWQQRNEQNDARYWRAYGANLGLDSRKVLFESGEQGAWNVSVGVDQLKRSELDTGQYVHQGLGTNTLTLAPGCSGFTNANSTTNPAIKGCLHGFEVQQGRDVYRMAVNGVLSSEWDYKLSFREDRRTGTRVTGLYLNFGLNVPYAIDDHTQQIEAVLGYTRSDAQWQLGYHYSRFRNNESTFDVANPFTISAGNTLARMSLMPDNQFHQVYTNGAYNFNKTTRLTGSLSYAAATQDEAFLPYSAALAAGATNNVTPRASLDGKVINTQADLALTMKPVDKASLKLAYQYRDNDNRTPIDQYLYISRDTNANTTSATAPIVACAPSPVVSTNVSNTANCRRNVPLSTTEQKLTADGDYEIAARTYFRTVLERLHKKYELADRTETDTDRVSFELRRPVSDEFIGSLAYTYTQRTGSDYDKNVFFTNSYNPVYQTNNGANNRGLTNHPSMRSFMYGDYRENRVRASGNWAATETVSFQAIVDGYHQRAADGPNCSSLSSLQNDAFLQASSLPDTCLGRTLAAGGSVNLDAQWQPEENLTTFAFVNLSATRTDIHGRTWTINTAQGADVGRDWFGEIYYRDAATGLGLKWQPVEAWDLGGTYVFSHSSGDTEIRTKLNPGDIPDTRSRLHSLQLFAKWDYSKAVAWRFNYVYEMLRSKDWAYDNAPAGSNNNVLFTGQTSAKYINHVVGVSVALKSW